MEYEIIKTDFSLNDPEKGFSCSYNDGVLLLRFTDWRNRPIELRFSNVFKFSCQYASGYRGLPEGEMLSIKNSKDISELITDGTAGKSDELNHYVISTNEEQWCEIIASRYDMNHSPTAA